MIQATNTYNRIPILDAVLVLYEYLIGLTLDFRVLFVFLYKISYACCTCIRYMCFVVLYQYILDISLVLILALLSTTLGQVWMFVHECFVDLALACVALCEHFIEVSLTSDPLS